MKGSIVKCLEAVVKTGFGQAKWEAILAAVGEPTTKVYLTVEDVPDPKVLALLGATAKTLGITMDRAMEAFGEHWSTVYAPAMYGTYFRQAKGTREFLLKLHDVHKIVTQTVPNARPPQFEYDASQPKRLVMKYSSSRGLVALMPGLIRGVAKFYNEKVTVSLAGNDVTVLFAA